jgi:general stress protein 26
MMKQSEEKVWDLVAKMDFCMLTTKAGKALHARPMSTIARKDDGVIVMLTDSATLKDDEIRKNPQVSLAYSDGSKTFVSISGSAKLNKDRAFIKELWNPGAQLFWPEGPENPSIVAIVVSPEDGEYWQGDNALTSGVKFAYGLATKSTPKMGDNRKVEFS